MQKSSQIIKHNNLILRNTFVLDELSILLSFFLALAIRYDEIQRWSIYNDEKELVEASG